jgi:S-adenosylmethionine:tRNA ribosyltransferase-isomerase
MLICTFGAMFRPPQIAIEAYNYELPNDRIAFTPADDRAGSKLLVWDQAIIAESHYANIAEYLPNNAQLFFNNSKVIAARLLFEKPSQENNASIIEIFCLEPAKQFTPVVLAMQAKQCVEWYCLVGGAKKWKEAFLYKELQFGDKKIIFKAQKIKQEEGQFLIRFLWDDNSISFSEILHIIGKIPLPPYIQRAANQEDVDRYQTTYAIEEGSVAAPTAGLHFSKEVFKSLAEKNIASNFITLHVGAGTFMPVKSDTIDEHIMHAEFIEVHKDEIVRIIEIKNSKTPKPIVSVGTTTLRTLESLYWLGVKKYKELKRADFLKKAELGEALSLGQWEAYELDEFEVSVEEAFNTLLKWMAYNQTEKLFAKTQLMVTPGYHFKICDALVTNFHQPKSTLLLIIAAIVKEQWKEIYQHALDNEYRFLSYGDGSLFWINKMH